MKFLGAFLVAAALALSSPALAQSPATVKLCIPVTPTSCVPVTASAPLPITGSFSATLAGFTPNGNYTTLTATAASSASTNLPAGTVVAFQNLSTIDVSCVLTAGVSTATTNKLIVRGGATVYYTVGSNTTAACINQTGVASNVVGLAGGDGLGTAFGGGGAGGGGGGAVTMVSGAVASGAYSAGSIAAGAVSAGAFVSGSILSGALASGAVVDLTNLSTPIAAGAATATKGVLLGGQFDTTQKTLTNGQQGAVSLSPRAAVYIATGAETPAMNITQVLGSAISATNGLFSNILQGNAALSATNGIFANILQGNAVLSATNPSFTRLTDATTATVVKAASTAAVAADPALVVAISPNNTVPANITQVLGAANSASNGLFVRTGSGQIASGSFASGSIASGAMVDLGAQADAACGTATGTCSLISLAKYLNTAAGLPLPTQASTVSIGGVGLFSGGSIMSATNGIYSNLLQGNAVLSATNPIFAKATDGTNSRVYDPCEVVAHVTTPISISTAATSVIVAGTSAKRTYICSMMLMAAGTTNVGIVQGSGTTCGTSTLGLIGGATSATGPNLTAQAGFVGGNGNFAIAGTTVNANDICLINSQAVQVSGYIVTATP